MVNTNLRKAAKLWSLVVFLSTSLSAQNIDVFEKYHKLGLVFQYNNFEAANVAPTNNNNNINYQIFKSKVFALGIAYNFHQYKNWNFKAELQLQWFGNNDGITILESENIANIDYISSSSTEHDKMGYLPVTAEYMLFKTDSFSFGIGVGIGLTYYWHYDLSGSSGLAINDVVLFEAFQREDYPLFYFSNHIQASMYFRLKSFMLQASVVYKKNLGDAFTEGHYEFKNLKQSPDIRGDFEQSGDFLGLSLTIYPKKE